MTTTVVSHGRLTPNFVANSPHFCPFSVKIVSDVPLLDIQMLLPLAGRLEPELIGLLITLGARVPARLGPLEALSMRN